MTKTGLVFTVLLAWACHSVPGPSTHPVDICSLMPGGWGCGQFGRPDGIAPDLASVWGLTADDVFVVGFRGTILRSVDRGTTWTSQAAPIPDADQVGVWGSGPGDVYTVGGCSTCDFHTSNELNWTATMH